MPFGRDHEEQRWFRGWYQMVVEPAIVQCGFEPILSASEDQPGAINDEIRAHLVFDPMVVVDLGGRRPEDPPNPNVMYELGLRHAFGLPLVIMAWEGQKLPFDVSNQRAITTRRDFMDIEPTRQKLARFIIAAREGRYYNPMEIVGREAAIDAASLVLGEESLLAALAKEVRELRTVVTARRARPDRQWGRRRKIKPLLGKDVRSALWSLAQQLGLDQVTWGKFLGTLIDVDLYEEMRDWVLDDWKQYLQQKAPELLEAERVRREEKAKSEEAQRQIMEQLLEQVATLLPPRPWSVNIHREIATKLDIPDNRAFQLINELIQRGRFPEQEDVQAEAQAPDATLAVG
jgi:hypothetical protein